VPGEGKEKKVGVIVSFLAMLELVRNGFMHAEQEGDFADINLEKII
jgi:chromatin segregation and condensation protein Rec8/ScpA/Scc1 (kleisin family)